MKIIPSDIKTQQFHGFLLGAIAPRPICFASTIDKEGNPNLSPFSFFNVFGSNPPVLIFSPARRVRDNSIKHTLENIKETMEVVINVVNYDMVQQMNLSSCEYPRGTNEFAKSGFTPVASELVKPYRVKESPAQMECKVLQIIETGQDGGAGNLIICEIVCMHLADEVLDANGQIDPQKIDLVARMGKDFYCRASGDAVFEVQKPNMALGIGIDNLPEHIRNSKVLTGNHLGMLGNSSEIPFLGKISGDERYADILRSQSEDKHLLRQALHKYAAELLNRGEQEKAWQVLLTEV